MPEPLRWQDWAARRQPRRAIFAVLVIAVAVAWAASFSWGYGLAAAIALLGATAPALLPVQFTLDDEGVRVDSALGHRRVPWADVDRWARAPDGVALIGRGRHSLVRRRRTVWLPCPGREEEVISWVSSRIGAAVPTP